MRRRENAAGLDIAWMTLHLQPDAMSLPGLVALRRLGSHGPYVDRPNGNRRGSPDSAAPPACWGSPTARAPPVRGTGPAIQMFKTRKIMLPFLAEGTRHQEWAARGRQFTSRAKGGGGRGEEERAPRKNASQRVEDLSPHGIEYHLRSDLEMYDEQPALRAAPRSQNHGGKVTESLPQARARADGPRRRKTDFRHSSRGSWRSNADAEVPAPSSPDMQTFVFSTCCLQKKRSASPVLQVPKPPRRHHQVCGAVDRRARCGSNSGVAAGPRGRQDAAVTQDADARALVFAAALSCKCQWDHTPGI